MTMVTDAPLTARSVAKKPLSILLQTTIPPTADDWGIERFDLLRQYLTGLKDENDAPLCNVTARNRQDEADGNDPVLSTLHTSDFDELWLFAVDVGNGLTEKEAAAITAFRQRGGGIMLTRDHQDLGSSVLKLGELGRAHHFHTLNPDPDPERCARDDEFTQTISWPNYHSGSNGDYQTISPTQPVHELLLKEDGSVIQYFASHPHEGGVGVPEGATAARVIATGCSQVTGRAFNLAVAFDRTADTPGRAVAESTFHHFADYNWNSSSGCPSFVTETCGNAIQENRAAYDDVMAYVRNLVLWLAPAS